MTLPTTEQVYVPLLDEGVDVWRPTQAEKLADGSYRLLPTADYDSDIEKWEFLPGTRVFCEPKILSKGKVLAAVRSADAARRSA